MAGSKGTSMISARPNVVPRVPQLASRTVDSEIPDQKTAKPQLVLGKKNVEGSLYDTKAPTNPPNTNGNPYSFAESQIRPQQVNPEMVSSSIWMGQAGPEFSNLNSPPSQFAGKSPSLKESYRNSNSDIKHCSELTSQMKKQTKPTEIYESEPRNSVDPKDVANLRVQLELLRRQYDIIEQENQSLREQTSSIPKDQKLLKSELDQATTEIQQLKLENQKLKAKNQAILNEIGSLR